MLAWTSTAVSATVGSGEWDSRPRRGRGWGDRFGWSDRARGSSTKSVWATTGREIGGRTGNDQGMGDNKDSVTGFVPVESPPSVVEGGDLFCSGIRIIGGGCVRDIGNWSQNE
jgi:hypothetical protein